MQPSSCCIFSYVVLTFISDHSLHSDATPFFFPFCSTDAAGKPVPTNVFSFLSAKDHVFFICKRMCYCNITAKNTGASGSGSRQLKCSWVTHSTALQVMQVALKSDGRTGAQGNLLPAGEGPIGCDRA